MTTNLISDAFLAFLQAPLDEKPGIVRQHEVLLSVEFEAWISEMKSADDGTGMYQAALANAVLLRRCRKIGINNAFAELAALMAAQPKASEDEFDGSNGESDGEAPPLPDEVIDLWNRAEAITPTTPDALMEKICLLEQCRDLLGDSREHGRTIGATQHNLGSLLQMLGEATGDIGTLRRAEAAYGEALKEHRRDNAPMDWAGTQNNLGILLMILGEATGDLDALRRAGASFGEALKERGQDNAPMERAATQNNLGNLLRVLGQAMGDIGTLHRAEAAYGEALEEYRRDNAPMEWAKTQNNLGTLLHELGEATGDIDTLRRAEAAFGEALKEWRRDNAPMGRAGTQNNLGSLLRMLGKATGDIGTLRRGEAAYGEALKEHRRDNAPMDWAGTQNNLGILLQTLGQATGDLDALHRAEAAFGEALKERRQDKTPMEWAMTQNNLGNLLLELGEAMGDIGTLRRAEAAYGEALKEYRQDNAPMEWAGTQNNLGSLLRMLGKATGDIGTLRRGEAAFGEALKEHRRDNAPMDWAAAQNNLGNLLLELGEATGDIGTLRRSEAAFGEALKERRRDNSPMEWAKTQSNLGSLLQVLGEATGDIGTLRRAEAAIGEALKERRRDNSPMDWAGTQNNLGALLRVLGKATGDIDALRRGEAAFGEAFKEYRQDNAPMVWAETQNNLGNLLQALGEATGEIDTLRRAEPAYLEALKEFRQDNVPTRWAETLRDLARLQVSREDWVNVAETLQELLSGIATTVAATPMRGEARGVLRHARGQGDRLAWALLQEGRVEAALLGAELGRAMMLRAHSALALVTADAATGERLLDLRAVWRAAVARLEAAGQSINDEVRGSFEAFRKALEEAGLGEPAPLSVADISANLPLGSVLVMPVVTEHGGAVFFVRQGQTALTDDHVLSLPDLTTASVRQLLTRDLNDDTNDEPELTGWLPGYNAFQRSIDKKSLATSGGAIGAWNLQIESTLSEMWDLFMKPVHEHLIKLGLTSGDKTGNWPGDPDDTAAAEVVLALPGLMSNLPWHAAGYQQKDGSRYFALRSWAISYIPSLGTMIAGRRELEKLRDTPNSLLAVTNPDNSFLDANKKLIRQSPVWDLFEDPYRTDLKGAKVAASPPDDVATLARITEAMPQAKYHVLYTHGSGNLAGADTAALTTVDNPLTIGHLRRMNLEAARYAMLAACDSGTLDIQHLPDEFSGMQLSMLEAGCPGACGTMWPVEVSVTAPLVREFFSHHLEQPGTGGLSPAQALRKAQLNMLDHAEPAPDSAFASTASGFDEDTDPTPNKDGDAQEHQRRPDVALPFFWAAFAHWGV